MTIADLEKELNKIQYLSDYIMCQDRALQHLDEVAGPYCSDMVAKVKADAAAARMQLACVCQRGKEDIKLLDYPTSNIMWLRYVDGLGWWDIAGQTNYSVESVQRHRVRGLKEIIKLRERGNKNVYCKC